MTDTISCRHLLALRSAKSTKPENGEQACQNELNASKDHQVYVVGSYDNYSRLGEDGAYIITSYAMPLEGCSTQNRARVVYSANPATTTESAAELQRRANLCADVLKQKTGINYFVNTRSVVVYLYGIDYLLPDETIYEVINPDFMID